MAIAMKRISAITLFLSVFFGIMNRIFGGGIWLTLTLSFATTAYHFVMRLFVGHVVDRKMNNKAAYSRKWFQVGPLEMKFYDFIKVKKWKSKMPSYQPELFSPILHTWDEIAQAMCQAELVHEVIVVLSFLPMIMPIWWGTFYVFLITSVCAACFDLTFVMMQRYNRPRVIRLAERTKRTRVYSAVATKE